MLYIQFDNLQKVNAGLEKKLEKINHLLLRTEESKSKLEELCRQLQKYNKDVNVFFLIFHLNSFQLREESASKIRLLETERQSAVEQLKTTLKVNCFGVFP